MNPHLLTCVEAARVLGVIPRRVQALIHDGQLKAVPFQAPSGRFLFWLIDPQELEDYQVHRRRLQKKPGPKGRANA